MTHTRAEQPEEPQTARERLRQALNRDPQVSQLADGLERRTAGAEGAQAPSALTRQKDEQELAPGNPRSLAQMEQTNPRQDGEDPVAYLDRIFG